MNHSVAKEILFKAKEIFDKVGVEFFLIYGTCLGAIRDNDFVATDTDIDLGVKHEILIPKIKELTNTFRDNGFYVQGTSYPYLYLRAFSILKDNILIDVRNFDIHEDVRFLQKVDSNRRDEAVTYDKKLFDNLKRINFLGGEFLVPNPTEEYLTRNYGDWKTPDPTFHKDICSTQNFWKKIGRKTIIL